MATYGTLRTLADELGHSEVAQLLAQTLSEEKNADQTLSKIARSDIYGRSETEYEARAQL